ncbi:MAG: tail fiber domain-containing protein [Bacteroidota bacterium]
MRFLLTSITTLAITLMLCMTVQAQITQSDFLGISPPGSPFDPFGKFTAIGESGGAPNGTVTGCDLYGFRAQLSVNPNSKLSTSAVSLGIQTTTRVSRGQTIPTLVFDDNRFWITSPQGDPAGVLGSDWGCGATIAFYSSRNIISGNVYTLFGSAVANGGNWTPSDLKLKEDVRPIGNALDMVTQLSGVTYRYKEERIQSEGMARGLQYGFIAQDVQKLIPSAVRQAEDPYDGQADYVVMRYEAIIPVLTEAIKEQQEIMDDQQITIDQQQGIIAKQQLAIDQLMNRLQEVESTLGIQSDVPANQNPQSPFDEIKLNQNRPNPADGNTIIEYTLPTEIAQAQLVIFDITGAEVQRYKVETGFGSVEIQDGVLAAGTYLYTLEVEGQSVARRKMVIQ